ncbi:MAG: large subunit ribosomal protein L20 [Candidatus Azotimanducaceae bacterium]|jgi:large subunit ribosomal protein L20
MARVKGGVTGAKRRKYVLEQTKGYRFGRSTKVAQAREAIFHANLHAFDHRKDKKGDFRRLWITRINAALKNQGLQYSRFIKIMADKKIALDRKVLATLAKDRPEAFQRVVDAVTK